jgi:hypothetical protein
MALRQVVLNATILRRGANLLHAKLSRFRTPLNRIDTLPTNLRIAPAHVFTVAPGFSFRICPTGFLTSCLPSSAKAAFFSTRFVVDDNLA